MDVKVVAEQKLVALRATEVVGRGGQKGASRQKSAEPTTTGRAKELDCPIKQGKFRTF